MEELSDQNDVCRIRRFGRILGVRNEMMCISDFFTRLKMYIVTKIYTEYERGAAPEVAAKREQSLLRRGAPRVKKEIKKTRDETTQTARLDRLVKSPLQPAFPHRVLASWVLQVSAKKQKIV